MNGQYSHTELYQNGQGKVGYGCGGLKCSCCYPSADKKGRRRIVRRVAKHNLRKEVICVELDKE